MTEPKFDLNPNPVGDWARLVYADWLDEHDQPVKAALQRVLVNPSDNQMRLNYADVIQSTDPERAELIRVQLQIPKLVYQTVDLGEGRISDEVSVFNKEECQQLRERERNLLDGNEYRWFPVQTTREVRIARQGVVGCCSRYADNMACDCLQTAISVDWSGGFVSTIRCTFNQWMKSTRLIRNSHPVSKVVLTITPGLVSRDDPENKRKVYVLFSNEDDCDDEFVHISYLELRDRKVPITGWDVLRRRFPGVTFKLPSATISVLLDRGQIVELETNDVIDLGDLVTTDSQGRVVRVGPGRGGSQTVLGRCVRGT